MQILRAANYKVMPWKNGLGSTTEIAIFPADAKLDDFDWRVSMAMVTSDGPFSSFPGINRTLLVIDGAGIDLNVDGCAPVRIDRNTIHSFPGDQQTSATLIDGSITDLNVMSRRGIVSQHVRRINVMKHRDFIVSAQTFLFVEHGTATIRSASTVDRLSAHDALLVERGSTPVTIESHATARAVIIEFGR
ncbi:HutD family protein [Tardiphaga sp. P9-11]|jgi:environmental stress-induced protein Ves|uniref:HutD/Ves family protein n=1 Tax=Tardiphaga sp. P9-11 TaxID=2024614 RepID=UPI0011F12B7E|nr:HutD family protein [Tardiphaga sp. P9-11]KAA0072803.1 HutD family protein [Tardiphaga sp. P9-11]